MLRADADDDFAAIGLWLWQRRPPHIAAVPFAVDDAPPEGVDGGRPQEFGDEQAVRIVVQDMIGPGLHDAARVYDHDAVGDAHGFYLIMRHIDQRDVEFLNQPL